MTRSIGIGPIPRRARTAGVLTLIAIGLLLAPLSGQAQIDFSRLWKELSPAVVSVETPTVGGGSGFVVQYRGTDGEPTWGIATACHVVADAPRSFTSEGAYPRVQVGFRAWAQGVQVPAAVVGCDDQRDVALLQPVNADGDVTTLPAYFRTLAGQRDDPDLRSFPRLWLNADGADLAPLTSVFAIGYPGPFAELNAVMGRVSGQLPIPYVQAADGALYAGEVMIVYEGAPDATLEEDAIRQIREIAGLRVADVAPLARQVLDKGLGMLILTSAFPGSDRTTGWDVVGVANGVVRVQERPIEIGSSLFGTTVTIRPRQDRAGTVSVEQRFMRLDAPVGSGFSGAPVMNTSGQVVGMVQWGLQDTPGGHFALPVATLAEALRALSAAGSAGQETD